MNDPVYLYRGSIKVMGEQIERADLPPGAERQSIAHYIDGGQQIDVFLIR